VAFIRGSSGPSQLGELPAGGIEEVKTRHLREQLGERLAAVAGADFSAPVASVPLAPPALPAKKKAPRPSSRPSAAGARAGTQVPRSSLSHDAGVHGSRIGPLTRAAPAPAPKARERDNKGAGKGAQKPRRLHRRRAPPVPRHAGALMRVVGGRLRGRALTAPTSQAIRPTADRLREALFNILTHAYDDPLGGARVLDLFAGTGALGLEALSRGAG